MVAAVPLTFAAALGGVATLLAPALDASGARLVHSRGGHHSATDKAEHISALVRLHSGQGSAR